MEDEFSEDRPATHFHRRQLLSSFVDEGVSGDPEVLGSRCVSGIETSMKDVSSVGL